MEAFSSLCWGCPSIVWGVCSASYSHCVLVPFSGHFPLKGPLCGLTLARLFHGSVFSALSSPHSAPGQEGLFPPHAGSCWVFSVGAPHGCLSSPALSHPSLGRMQQKTDALGHAGALKVRVLGCEIPLLTPQLGTWSVSQYGSGKGRGCEGGNQRPAVQAKVKYHCSGRRDLSIV